MSKSVGRLGVSAGSSDLSIFSTFAGLVTFVVDDSSFSVVVVVASFSVVVVVDGAAVVVDAAVSVPLLPHAVAPRARPAIPRTASFFIIAIVRNLPCASGGG